LRERAGQADREYQRNDHAIGRREPRRHEVHRDPGERQQDAWDPIDQLVSHSGAADPHRIFHLNLWILNLARLFAWVRVEGRENLKDLEGPVLFASNHQGYFDTPILFMAMPWKWRHRLAPGFLFSLGRLNRRKNLERLLLAYGRLRTAGVTDVPLVIGGKPDFGVEDVLRRAKLASDGSKVRFVGLIPDSDLPHFYAGASCFVYPSLFEGFGLPLAEAMACGTPVISSSRTALPELVGDAGLLVDPESVDAIVAAVTRVLTDRDLAGDLGRRGLERSRRYSWAETARRTLDIYRASAAASR
jgi:hypothetical protein